jgi:VRR-NUC domain
VNETNLTRQIWRALSDKGVTLFRNNVGKLCDARGRWVTFGLHVGSGDLIGWTPTLITPDMVGRTLAVFTSVEVKTPTGKVSRDQQHWQDAVTKAGGVAVVLRDVP